MNDERERPVSSEGQPTERKPSVRQAAVLSYAEKYAALALGIIYTMVLSRILTPEQVGIFSVAAVLTGIAGTIRDFGAGTYIVQEPELTSARVRAAFGLALLLGGTLAAVAALASIPAARFYGNPGVGEVLLVLALNFLIVPFGSITQALLMRDLRFGAVGVINVAHALTQTAAGISFALLGFGYMSLAYASVLAALVSAFASVLFRPKALPWMPRFTDMKRVTVFGGRVSATTLINEVHDGAGDLFVGRALGLETVGYFARANSFVTLYTRLVLRAAWPVSYSVFAQRYRSGGDVGAALRQFTGIVSGVAWPGLVFLALYADAAVLLLFGSQWGASVTPARFLLAAAFVLVPVSFCTGALTATGDAKMALKLAAVQLAMRVVSLLVGLQFGLIGAAIGIASGSLVASFIVAAVAARALAFAWREWIAAVAPSLMLALLTNIVPAALLASDALASLPAIGRLAAAGALAAIAFVVSAFATGHAIAGEIRRLTGKLGGRFAA